MQKEGILVSECNGAGKELEMHGMATRGHVHKHAHGRVRFQAMCIPPKKGLNWSLGNLYSSLDARINPQLAAEVGLVLTELNSHTAYAPSVGDFSGVIVRPKELKATIRLGKETSQGPSQRRNEPPAGRELHHERRWMPRHRGRRGR